MLMLPITFLPAAGLVILAIWLLTQYAKPLRAPWLIAFLFSLALQLILLGVRFGYYLNSVLAVQHLTGVIIPPLAYLAFTNPRLSIKLSVHVLPILCMATIIHIAPHLADTLLALITFGYAFVLAAILINNPEIFSWGPIRFEPILRMGLWATLATLIISGLTDSVIAVDYLITGGDRTSTIATIASLAGLALLITSIFFFLRFSIAKKPDESTEYDKELALRITNELERNNLYRDPDLTLNRLAKRLHMPTRQISQAINRSSGLNVSQFINNMRISAVCTMLTEPEVSVTNAMLEAGFFTKSNFNREFLRVTGKSPTAWRADNGY